MDTCLTEVQSRQQVVVQGSLVAVVQPHGHRDIGREAGVEAHLPAPSPVVEQLAPRQHQRNGELAIHGEQVGGRVTFDVAADLGDHPFGLADDLWMQSAQELIHLQILVVPIWGEAHRLVGANQTAESMCIGRRRWHAIGLVDDQAGEVPVALVQVAQLLDQLLVAVAMCPCAQDALRRVEELRRHDALERTFLLDPHVGRVDHP